MILPFVHFCHNVSSYNVHCLFVPVCLFPGEIRMAFVLYRNLGSYLSTENASVRLSSEAVYPNYSVIVNSPVITASINKESNKVYLSEPVVFTVKHLQVSKVHSDDLIWQQRKNKDGSILFFLNVNISNKRTYVFHRITLYLKYFIPLWHRLISVNRNVQLNNKRAKEVLDLSPRCNKQSLMQPLCIHSQLLLCR